MAETLDLERIYLIVWITGLILTLLYALFGDFLDVFFESIPGTLLHPTVILGSLTSFALFGYIFEKVTQLSTLTIIILSTLISLIVVSLIYFLIVKPLMDGESTAHSIEDVIGAEGQVATAIPKKGLGEVILNVNRSLTNHPAKSNTPIREGTKIRVTGREGAILLVEPVQQEFPTFEEQKQNDSHFYSS